MTTAVNAGLSPNNIHFSNQEADACYRKKTVIPARFRRLRYFIRKIGGESWGRRSKTCKLPKSSHQTAFSRIVNSVIESGGIKSLRKYSKLLIVLVYDRENIKRRRWNNLDQTLHKLLLDKSLYITYITALPKSFRGQLRVFRKSDIVITSHGTALANSLFMRKGSEAIEINKCCKE